MDLRPVGALIFNSSHFGLHMACMCHEGDILVPVLTIGASLACAATHGVGLEAVLDLRNHWGVVRCPYLRSLSTKFASATSN